MFFDQIFGSISAWFPGFRGVHGGKRLYCLKESTRTSPEVSDISCNPRYISSSSPSHPTFLQSWLQGVPEGNIFTPPKKKQKNSPSEQCSKSEMSSLGMPVGFPWISHQPTQLGPLDTSPPDSQSSSDLRTPPVEHGIGYRNGVLKDYRAEQQNLGNIFGTFG